VPRSHREWHSCRWAVLLRCRITPSSDSFLILFISLPHAPVRWIFVWLIASLLSSSES
jgi:hypothetical protein